jgi:Tol biopolymer transport system component
VNFLTTGSLGANTAVVPAIMPRGIAYASVSASLNRELHWLDRTGKRLGAVTKPGPIRTSALSPDDTKVAYAMGTPRKLDVWVQDLTLETAAQFTFDGDSRDPVWSPDGSRIVFSSNRDGPMNLYQRAASGPGNDEAVLKSDNRKLLTDWSADGRLILYAEQDPKTRSDLWILPLSGEQKPFPFLQTDFFESQGQFSPDGKWIAYTSNESGAWQVYVRSFPDTGGKWPVSTNGGVQPRWRSNQKELFYISPDKKLMAVDVKMDGPSPNRAETEIESGYPCGCASADHSRKRR